MRELEKDLKAQRDQAERKLKEAEDRENTTRQSERVQVECLLALAHVVGGNVPSEFLVEIFVFTIQSNWYLGPLLCRCFWDDSSSEADGRGCSSGACRQRL